MKKLLLPLLLACQQAAWARVAHDLDVSIDPATGRLEAEDRVSFPSPKGEFVFALHSGFAPAADGKLEKLPPEEAAKHGLEISTSGVLEAYRLTPAKPAAGFTLKYAGTVAHGLGETAEDYARSFSETPGLISADGCYLSGASGWYPYFAGELVTFRLRTALPSPYTAVAGGGRTSHAPAGSSDISVWQAERPLDDITLACGKYTEYSAVPGKTSYFAFLREPDRELADKYLGAAEKYTAFYSSLLGPYPYPKFALVENFWETGYGLPSFTLLGPKVIRLPFILNSSYPHEILHNWWGNGVFVDYASGNWCEGLTAYLADYLIAESRGKGREYRMTTLQKYSDYVRGAADFPLTAFRSRHSSASEAIGYGKSLMLYHMLRRALGDGGFRKGLREFYRSNLGRTASFSDLRAAFETVSGPGRLKDFFSQWTERAGAPELALASAKVTRGLDGYDLEFRLLQKQPDAPFKLDVPVAITLDGAGEPRMKTVRMDSADETYHYSSPLRPLRLEVDPEFDVFRKLDPLETPPTLSRLLGAEKPRLVLPSGAGAAAWTPLAAAWTKDKANLPEVLPDTAAAPSGASYWVLGGDNRLAAGLETALGDYGARFTDGAVFIGNRRFERDRSTFVFAAFSPAGPDFSAALVLSGSPEKLPLLAAKLPHYGKYSWLVFDKDMNSAATGVWEVFHSPLAADLSGGRAVRPAPYPARAPLAELPSDFSAARMAADAAGLAALPGGRAPGTPGHEQAAAFIAGEMKKAGLEPFDGKAFRQAAGNVVGMVKGKEQKDKYLVLSAHYDHLPAREGAAYPGADDNASGSALLLELARYYAAHPQPRSMVFAAFDGEEAGRAGSKAFVAALPPDTKGAVNADLNFDTVGRLGAGKILALGSSSSDKWVHIFRGAGFVTGADYDLVKEDLDSSDQASFIEAGVPAVQFFSGPNQDYHKPSDTADKLDPRGMVKEAEFASEIIGYLAGTADFITRPAGTAPAPGLPQGERKASTGLVPDFSFPGPGVRAQDVTPGSPLAAAGFLPGDVITDLNGETVADLRSYSAALKKLNPGQKVTVGYLSGGVRKAADITLAAR